MTLLGVYEQIERGVDWFRDLSSDDKTAAFRELLMIAIENEIIKVTDEDNTPFWNVDGEPLA